MTALDTANSLAALLDMEAEGKLGVAVLPEDNQRNIPQHGATGDRHYRALATRLGCSESYVRNTRLRALGLNA